MGLSMDLLPSDVLMATLVPILVYWIYAGVLHLMADRFDNYRLHSKNDGDLKNLVSNKEAVRGVLVQQALQATLSLLLFMITSDGKKALQPSFLVQAKQFLVAMVVFDTWEYFMHRFLHVNKFMYRRFHSWHHRLVVPYTFGAIYGHPVDGVLVDMFAGITAHLVSGMTPLSTMFFLSFATIKTVDDHCGLLLPWNPLHWFSKNNTAYHYVHHQLFGSKYNFCQPFFAFWDMVLGTGMPFTLEKRLEGGFEVRPAMKDD